MSDLKHDTNENIKIMWTWNSLTVASNMVKILDRMNIFSVHFKNLFVIKIKNIL